MAVPIGKVRVEHQGRELYLLLLLIGFILILAELATFQLLVSVYEVGADGGHLWVGNDAV